MKIFLDSANIDEIRILSQTGLIDGVTTNPTLIAKSGQDFKRVIADICHLISGPVSAEVVALKHEEMIQEGLILSRLSPNVVVKIPLTLEGLKACRLLRAQGVAVNVTLCFSPGQALLAAKAEATYLSPFLGRLDDLGYDGFSVLQQIRHIYQHYPLFKTQILAASLRHPLHVVQAATAGVDIVTISGTLFQQLYTHPLTDKGLTSFLADWSTTGQTIL